MIIVLGIVLTVLYKIGSAGLNNRVSNNSDASNQITNTAAPKSDPIVVDVDTLASALEENVLGARDTYKDKYVEVTGRLSYIDSSGKYIRLSQIDDKYPFTSIMCYITPEQQEIVAGLKKDELVTVIGTITDVGGVMDYSMKVESFK